MNDLGEAGQAAVAQPPSLDQRLERAVLAVMAQLHAGRVERDGVLRKLRGRREHEHGLRVDEALDQPRRGDAIDVGTRAGDPAPAAKLGQIERRRRFTAGRFRTTGAHGDGLLETPDLGAARGVEEIDAADPLIVFRQPGELVVHAGARRRRLPVEALQQPAVSHREVPVVLVARLVEEPQDVGRTQVLDLVDAHERRLASVSLDLLREPLEVLVAVRCVGEQVGGALEGDGPERAEPSPHPNAQARRRRRQSDQQQE